MRKDPLLKKTRPAVPHPGGCGRLRPYRPWQRRTLCRLVARYFREDLHLPVTDAQAEELAREMAGDIRFGVPLELLWLRGRAVGFIDYQIDRPGGSWCFHPGRGCIRECYLLPEVRGRGLGRRLARYAENRLRRRGAARVYLTADTAAPFWQALGYADSGRVNEKNGLHEWEKPL